MSTTYVQFIAIVLFFGFFFFNMEKLATFLYINLAYSDFF